MIFWNTEVFTFHCYVRITPVRTYIAKSPKRAIYAILYGAEVVWVILTQTNRFRSSSHFENLISVISFFLYKKVSLTWWQDKFWEHMVAKYPDLERGESASQTGRDHIPPRIFKEMTHLTQQRQKLDQLLTGIGPLNGKKRAAEISELLDGYIPAVEKMRTQLKKYSTAFSSTKAENEKLKRKNKKLSESLEEATHESVLKKLEDAKLQREYEEALAVLERIPPEVLEEYAKPKASHRTAEL